MTGMTPGARGAKRFSSLNDVLAAAGPDPFRSMDLRRLSLQRSLMRWLADRPRRFAAGAWLLRPYLSRRHKTSVVTGYDAVQEVLRDGRSFPVPFGVRFKEMNSKEAGRPGANFILGMNEEAEYAPIHGEAMRAFRFEDLPRVAGRAGRLAEEFVAEATPDGRIDAMAGLLTKVPVRLVGDYYGVEIEEGDQDEFPLWTMAMSTYAFAGPLIEPQDGPAAVLGAQRVGEVVDRAVRAAVDRDQADTTTILGRLVAARRERLDGETLLGDDALRATMIGLITGFVPTCSKASANILAVLLRQRDAREAAEAAARTGDDELLARCLFEALRFKQALPGIFRSCEKERVLPGGQRVRADTWVWALTQLAAFDKERVARPWDFDPGRGDADSLGFGFGQHRCFGAALARAQIAATFKPLLLRGHLRKVEGADRWPTAFCTFVEHHHVAFGGEGRR